MTDEWEANKDSKRLLLTLLSKITIYYILLFGLFLVALKSFPALLDSLPVGGVGELSAGAASEISELEDALLSGDFDSEEFSEATGSNMSSRVYFVDARYLLFSMIGSLLLMLPVSWVYKAIHRDGEHDHSLDETTLVLPAVVAGIVTVVQHSLALAFSLAGIVAGVQFRRALSDTFDTLFIFVAIAVGIAAGIKALDIALVITVFFNYSALLVCLLGDGLESQHMAQKKRLRALLKAEQKLAKIEEAEKDG
ncbi:MAG: DUF4956 domain-containing protein [Gammaproteobacteria bacterium]|nr:DUF4956 domain-containing protein [Gammaproteobacteria bacterium]